MAGIIFGIVKCCQKVRNINNLNKNNAVSEQNSDSSRQSLFAKENNSLSKSKNSNGEQLQNLLNKTGQLEGN